MALMAISFIFINPFQKIAFKQKIKIDRLLCCLFWKVCEVQEIC